MKHIIITLLLIALIPFVSAQKSTILLAVSETPDGLIGITAELVLEIKPGSGNIFITTYPLSKLDTQISTRFAKDMACKNLNRDCSIYDFFYTIKANTPIIGGPSAGAAIAAMTIAELDNLDIKEDVAITGTINSGGFIGPVGGLKEKIEVAKKSGIKTVLIPKAEVLSNATELEEIRKSNNIQIIEVSELDEVLFHLTGKEYEKIEGDIRINKEYKKVMGNLANDLCNRSLEYRKNIKDESAANLTEKGLAAREKGYDYSAGSFCFGANILYRIKKIEEKKPSHKEILSEINKTKKRIENMDSQLQDIKYKSLTDLETYMIVQERLIGAYDLAKKSQEELEANNTKNSINNLAFANERVYSAYLWAKFFGIDKEPIELNEELIKNSCLQKISEAKESHQFVRLYYPEALEKAEKELNRAIEDLQNKHYELCLFKASKAKAEANVVLNVVGVENSRVKEVIKQKLNIIKKGILKEQQKNRFPIVGYSYYEYAQNLLDSDPYSALLYAEYALELSDLDIYFNKKDRVRIREVDIKEITIIALSLIVGMVLGSFLTLLIFKNRIIFKKKKDKILKKKKNKTQARFRRIPQGKKR